MPSRLAIAGNPASSIMGQWLVEDGNGGTTSLTVNDTSDTNLATVSLNDDASGGSVVFAQGPTFSFKNGFLTTLTVDGGSGGNTFTVNNTPATVPTTIYTGAGTNTVYVIDTGTGSLLTIHGQGGQDTVDIGDGHASTYDGDVSVDNTQAGSTNLVVDDSKVTTSQNIAF